MSLHENAFLNFMRYKRTEEENDKKKCTATKIENLAYQRLLHYREMRRQMLEDDDGGANALTQAIEFLTNHDNDLLSERGSDDGGENQHEVSVGNGRKYEYENGQGSQTYGSMEFSSKRPLGFHSNFYRPRSLGVNFEDDWRIVQNRVMNKRTRHIHGHLRLNLKAKEDLYFVGNSNSVVRVAAGSTLSYAMPRTHCLSELFNYYAMVKGLKAYDLQFYFLNTQLEYDDTPESIRLHCNDTIMVQMRHCCDSSMQFREGADDSMDITTFQW